MISGPMRGLYINCFENYKHGKAELSQSGPGHLWTSSVMFMEEEDDKQEGAISALYWRNSPLDDPARLYPGHYTIRIYTKRSHTYKFSAVLGLQRMKHSAFCF